MKILFSLCILGILCSIVLLNNCLWEKSKNYKFYNLFETLGTLTKWIYFILFLFGIFMGYFCIVSKMYLFGFCCILNVLGILYLFYDWMVLAFYILLNKKNFLNTSFEVMIAIYCYNILFYSIFIIPVVKLFY